MLATEVGRKKRILRLSLNGSSAFVLLYVLDSAAAVVQNVVLARFLDLEQYGILAALLSLGMFAFVLSDFGTSLAVCRLLASAPVGEWAARYRSLWTARAVLSLVMTCALAGAAAAWWPRLGLVAVLLLSSEFFRSIAHFICSAARGAGKVAPVMAALLCDRLGTLIGVCWAVLSGRGLVGVGAAYLVARVFSFALAVAWTRSACLSLGLARITRSLIGDCLSLAPLATLLLSDRVVFYSMPVVITLFGSSAAAGMFQASFKIAVLPISLCSALVGAYFPDFVKDASSGGSPARAVSVYSLVTTVAAPVVALCVLYPAELLSVLFGEPFMAGADCLRLLGLFILLNISYQLSVHLLPAYEREGILLRSSSAAALACVLVAAVAVPRLGATGAAVAVTLYALIALVPNCLALRGAFRLLPHEGRTLGDTWFALAICLGATSLLRLLTPSTPVLLMGWAGVSGTVLLSFLFRNRTVFRQLFL